jgi:hypothetical protein
MADKTRKRTPEEIRLIPVKGTGPSGGRQQRQEPKKTKKSGGPVKQHKRQTSNKSVKTHRTSDTTRPVHRVASTRKKSVMFTLDAPSGLDVSVAGSFNDWKPQAMTKGPDGLWRITVQLAQGTYEYRFLVDADWREDPNNPRKTQNDFGGYDSICDVL